MRRMCLAAVSASFWVDHCGTTTIFTGMST
jgi:hypothetical protein